MLSIIHLLTVLPLVSSLTVSPSARCGASFGLTCSGSRYGECCSSAGWCGSTAAYCASGCQSSYGKCSSSSRPVAKVSTDGTCGGPKGYTCLGSVFGNCCSSYGWCDSTSTHCGKGCQSSFGTCSDTSSAKPSSSSTRPTSVSSSAISTLSTLAPSTTLTSTPVAAPSSKSKISTNGRCGSAYDASPGGMTCLGSKYGNCCSQYSYCGSTNAYCGKGCQVGFGSCNGNPSSSSMASSSSNKQSSSSFSITASLSSNTVTSISSDATSSSVISSFLSSAVASSSSASPSMSASPSSTPVVSSSVLIDTSSTAPTTSVLTSSTAPLSPSNAVSLSASSCAPTPTNAVKNPSFESGLLGSWTVSATDRWSFGATPDLDSRTGSKTFYAATSQEGLASVTLTQSGIKILDGTTVTCHAYAKLYKNGGYATTFQIFIDDVACGGAVVSPGENWDEFGVPKTVAGDSHTVKIVVTSYGSDEAGQAFYIDDVELIPIGGPGAVVTCDQPVASSSSPVIETSSSILATSTSSSNSVALMSSSVSEPSSSVSEPSSSVSEPSSSVSEPSSSVSEPSSSVSEPLSSSSTASSSSLDLSTSSSTVLVVPSATSSTPTSSACTPSSTIPASFNPSFESGSLSPWTLRKASDSDRAEVLSSASAPFVPLDGNSAFYVTAFYRPGSYYNYDLTIAGVPIPAGSTYNCTMGIKIVDNSSPTAILRAAMYLDSRAVNNNREGTFASNTIDWRLVGGRGVATAADTHTFIVRVIVPAGPSGSVTFAYDRLHCYDPTTTC